MKTDTSIQTRNDKKRIRVIIQALNILKLQVFISEIAFKQGNLSYVSNLFPSLISHLLFFFWLKY